MQESEEKREEEILVAQQESAFQQRVIAATLPHDPKLEIASTLFPEVFGNSQSAESGLQMINDEEAIFFPSSSEELEDMIQLFEGLDLDRDG